MDKRDKKEMNRREFLKIVGVSTVASTVAMYGCASGEKSNASEASILGEVPVDKMTYMTIVKIFAFTYTLMPSLCFEVDFYIICLLSAIYSLFIDRSSLV